ncbi:hypothetical protein [Brevundimonas sp.]|uniref:hypothetical protein n=1 Tax=Brevundimonas sp. TaxID=1871086 RepID=UPI0028A2A4C4|nr:hypothetical protein [Brevundimonas sp.]
MTRTSIIRVMLAVAAASALTSGPALAHRTHSVERTYYTDATMTVVSGYSIATCNGGMHGYGQTPWFEESREPCAGGWPGTPPYP